MFSTADQFQSCRKDVNFREYKPYARGNAARITEEQWEPYFPLIRCLHNARRTRAQILEVLREHGLEPSTAQLYAKMSKWGLKGYGLGNSAEQDIVTATTTAADAMVTLSNNSFSLQTSEAASDSTGDSAEESQSSSDAANIFSENDHDTSDTMYETEGPLPTKEYNNTTVTDDLEQPTYADTTMSPTTLNELIEADATSHTIASSNVSSTEDDMVMTLPTDLMAFVRSTSDINDFDQHDILNEVASFLCATSSFSDAFVLFDASHTFLRENKGTPMALVFATINCLRSATFKEQCQYAGSLMGEALGSFRLWSYSNPYATTAFSSLEEIGRELCVKSELEHLNILYTQMQFRETTYARDGSSRTNTNELLLHCSDPFLLAKADDRPELLTQSMEVSGIALGRIIGKLSRWCCSEIEDFNPVAMLPSAGFNPSDTISVARFATALSCHFIRKWSFLSLAEVLAKCNELLPPNRRDAAARLCKLAIRVLSTLAVYTIYQATGVTLRSVSGDAFTMPLSEAQYLSPLASHLDILSRMRSRDRVLVFAEMHKTLYNRTLVYRQQMDDHCLTAHVRETGFLLAASLIRLKRELNSEVPKPASISSSTSSSTNPFHDRDRTRSRAISTLTTSTPSRTSSTSSTSTSTSDSMMNLATRNLSVPGIMSKNGIDMRRRTTRRLSTASNESWNFTTVTGLPCGLSPPPQPQSQSHPPAGSESLCRQGQQQQQHDEDEEMTDTTMF